MRAQLLQPLLALIVVLSIGLGCGGDATGPEVVTISGTVINFDSGSTAQGVRVSHLGTTYANASPTGSDGAFSLQVPRDIQLLLHTDDFGSQNNWFPMINADYPGIDANGDISGLTIYACPDSAALGSVAAWNNFLQNWDDSHGDRFVPRRAAESGGVILVHHPRSAFDSTTSARACGGTPGLQFRTNTGIFPVGYINSSKYYGPNGPDPSLGPDILYPADYDSIVDGPAISFGGAVVANPFADDQRGARTSSSTHIGPDILQLTFVDTDTSRNIGYPNPFATPVVDGTVTLIFVGSIDQVGGKHRADVERDCAP